MKNRAALHWTVIFLGLSLLLVACGSSEPEAGPVGPQGPAGPIGPVGPPGTDGSFIQEYVGSDRCGQCHLDEFEKHAGTGHAVALTRVNSGVQPELPGQGAREGFANLPEGVEWGNVSYVIGGRFWRAILLGVDGYPIANEEGSIHQLNLENDLLETQTGWISGGPAPEAPQDCVRCHTTGYRTIGHQDGLEGILGTWTLDGVQCEACHGPGNLHAENPYGIQMVIDRSSKACAACHSREEGQAMVAENGFGVPYQQHNELLNSKHYSLDCVTCHDPHASTVLESAIAGTSSGIVVACDNCHWQQTAEKVDAHPVGFVSCSTCHMPPMGVSAVGNLDLHLGDLHSHQFSINPDFDAPQFSSDGTTVQPYLTLPYVCGACHNGVVVQALSAGTLESFATGYHNP